MEMRRHGADTEGREMTLDEIMDRAKDTISVRRVFGEPVERDGLTLIPAAVVMGGAGGGQGPGAGGAMGEGGGLGMIGRPIGAFVIKDGVLSWRPVVDVQLMVGIAAAVTVVCLLSRSRLGRARARAEARAAQAQARAAAGR